jgi:hypothetical protein
MKSNYWEEQDMVDKIKQFHDKEVEKMGLPDFTDFPCPHCKKKIPSHGIRNIALKLNTRNIGDISVTFNCDDCLIMDTVYFRKAVDSMQEFADCVSNNKKVDTEPTIEEEMYKLRYNNLMEKFTEDSIL